MAQLLLTAQEGKEVPIDARLCEVLVPEEHLEAPKALHTFQHTSSCRTRYELHDLDALPAGCKTCRRDSHIRLSSTSAASYQQLTECELHCYRLDQTTLENQLTFEDRVQVSA